MDKIAALIKAQANVRSPEGRMAEAAALAALFSSTRQRKGKNQFTAGTMTDRIMSKVAFGASDCWYWIAGTSEDGYGKLYALGESLAHRVSYRVFSGDIPDGMCVMHSCDTRCCVNPAHLVVGVHADNMADMAAKKRHRGRQLHGADSPNAKLTADQVAAMRNEYASGGIAMSALATKYGISSTSVCRIVNNQRWKI